MTDSVDLLDDLLQAITEVRAMMWSGPDRGIQGMQAAVALLPDNLQASILLRAEDHWSRDPVRDAVTVLGDMMEDVKRDIERVREVAKSISNDDLVGDEKIGFDTTDPDDEWVTIAEAALKTGIDRHKILRRTQRKNNPLASRGSSPTHVRIKDVREFFADEPAKAAKDTRKSRATRKAH